MKNQLQRQNLLAKKQNPLASLATIFPMIRSIPSSSKDLMMNNLLTMIIFSFRVLKQRQSQHPLCATLFLAKDRWSMKKECQQALTIGHLACSINFIAG